jgi:AcrR family transcriptional regulator
MRGQILDTAEALFARQGFSATSIREIADEVGVNPAMVHYYFGSKRALLRQVLAQTFEPLAEAISQMKEAGRAPMAEIIRLLSGALRKHPNLPVLMIREVMLPGGVMQEEFLETMAPRLGGSLPAMLAVEQKQGRLAPDLDPNIAALLLLALSVFPFIVRDVAGPGLGIAYDEAGLDAMQNHITHLLGEGFLK